MYKRKDSEVAEASYPPHKKVESAFGSSGSYSFGLGLGDPGAVVLGEMLLQNEDSLLSRLLKLNPPMRLLTFLDHLVDIFM
jgi:hypothetical protein